jgi:hypothetical protein
MTRTVLARWPAAFGVAVAALSLADYRDSGEATLVLTIAATGYILAALVDRPALTWPLVVVLCGVVVALRALDVDPAPVLGVSAPVLAVIGVATGRLRRSRLHLLQAPVAAVVAIVALTALGVPETAAALLAAAGLAGHAAWDAVMWRADRILARSFAEWCGALDAVLAVGIAAITLA